MASKGRAGLGRRAGSLHAGNCICKSSDPQMRIPWLVYFLNSVPCRGSKSLGLDSPLQCLIINRCALCAPKPQMYRECKAPCSEHTSAQRIIEHIANIVLDINFGG